MTAAWPSVTPKATGALTSGFSEQVEDSVAEFAPDVGPPKRRRRSSLTNDMLTFTNFYTSTDYDTIRTFYKTTIHEGVDPFTMTHPRTGNSNTWIFTGPPKITQALGNSLYQVSFSLRMIA